MLAHAAFGRRKERHQGAHPLPRAALEIASGERVGQLLEARGIPAGEEGVATLPTRDALGAQAVGEPVVLIQTYPC